MLAIEPLNTQTIRKDFPMLKTKMNGLPLVYLDNAATTQKPLSVIDRLSNFYKNEYATVRRGVYTFSQDSTRECDLVREKCRKFLNAQDVSEIIFTRGTTESINLVATSYGRKFLKKGDEILTRGGVYGTIEAFKGPNDQKVILDVGKGAKITVARPYIVGPSATASAEPSDK